MTTPIDWTTPPALPVEGAMMKQRDGEIVGPLEYRPSFRNYPWICRTTKRTWTITGAWTSPSTVNDRYDLVEIIEVNPEAGKKTPRPLAPEIYVPDIWSHSRPEPFDFDDALQAIEFDEMYRHPDEGDKR